MVKTLLIIVGIAAAFGGGWFLAPRHSFFTDAPYAVEDFPFINPSATLNLKKHFIINMSPLREEFTTIRARFSQKTYVYFAYLNNDSWIGLNERDHFVAASTIKVPLSMAIMKMVEEGKLALDTPYTLAEEDLDDRYGDLYKRGVGATLTIRELIEVMLTQSDNTSMKALFHIARDIGITDPLADVYAFMGWDSYANFGETPTYIEINLKTLSNMFLSLYNAKFVDLEHSQIILSYLDHSIFNDEIPAGVPESISVAHKVGMQVESNSYTDCGIVYAPNRNYLLCVGSEGADKATADKFIAEISHAAYDFVINN